MRPTLKARLKRRRAYNNALAKQDAANRCSCCRGPLPKVPVVLFGRSEKYCRLLCLPREA